MLCNFIFYLSESVKQVTAHDVISLWLAGAINILTYNFLVNTITNIASLVYKLLFLWSLVSCCETSLVCFYQCGFITFVLGSCLSNHTGKKNGVMNQILLILYGFLSYTHWDSSYHLYLFITTWITSVSILFWESLRLLNLHFFFIWCGSLRCFL